MRDINDFINMLQRFNVKSMDHYMAVNINDKMVRRVKNRNVQ